MDLEELQATLDRLEAWGGARDGLTVQIVLDLSVAVEAARRWLTPNIEAATAIAEERLPQVDWTTAGAFIQDLVAAALTSQGDTDGS